MYETAVHEIDAALHSVAAGDTTNSLRQGDPIDRAHLARYTLGDPALEREILGLFLAQLPLTLEALKFASSDRDWHMAAHTLKGSARAVGAWDIARLAQQAEKLGRNAGGATTAIVARIEEAVAAVDRLLAQAEAA